MDIKNRNAVIRAMRRKRQRRLRLYRMGLLLVAVIAIVGSSAWLILGQKETKQTAASSLSQPKGIDSATYTIVLDSGHSTYNVGAHGLVKEEEITAQTTEYLRQLLEQDEHYNVILTHDYDTHATVAERREIGIESNCDFFVSIHCNSNASDSTIQGFEIYTQLPENPNHQQSYDVATTIASKLIAAGHTPRAEEGIFYCRYVPDENGDDTQYTLTESEEAATDLGGTTYGVIKSDLYPGILIEQGYVNSQTDVTNWMSEAGMQAAAQIYYEALCDYFETPINS